jgi:hypothetical protein
MSAVKRILFVIEIAAPASKVYDLMIGEESYRNWTAAFVEGSYYKGSWRQGEQIRFLSPDGDGMLAEIAENKLHEFISIRHLGYIEKGVEDTESEAIRAWAPAYENYTFIPVLNGTRLVVDQDVTVEYESYMLAAWPKALERLKIICEVE